MLPFVLLAFDLAGRPVIGTEGLMRQHQMLMSVFQIALTFAVTVATLHSASQNAEARRRERRRDEEGRFQEKVGLVHALAGSAIEAIGFGSTVATLQQHAAESPLRFPEPRGVRDLRVVAWTHLAAATAGASKALERIRYSEDDLLDTAERLNSVVIDIQQLASEGRREELEAKAVEVRELHEQLRAEAQRSRDRSAED